MPVIVPMQGYQVRPGEVVYGKEEHEALLAEIDRLRNKVRIQSYNMAAVLLRGMPHTSVPSIVDRLEETAGMIEKRIRGTA